MKLQKRILSAILALVLLCCQCVSVFSEEWDSISEGEASWEEEAFLTDSFDFPEDDFVSDSPDLPESGQAWAEYEGFAEELLLDPADSLGEDAFFGGSTAGEDGLVENEMITMQPISTAEDFKRIADNPGGYYCLTQDIYLGAYTPVAYDFTGVLDGQGHCIRGLTITSSVDGSAGLFKQVYGLVKNLDIINASIEVPADANGNPADVFTCGVLTGRLYGEISNCNISGKITVGVGNVYHNHVGGVVGDLSETARLKDVTSTVNIDASIGGSNYLIGGLVGFTLGGSALHCKTNSTIRAWEVSEGVSFLVVNGMVNSGKVQADGYHVYEGTTEGQIELNLAYSYGWAIGLSDAVDSVNKASVTVNCENAQGHAVGVLGGKGVINEGPVTIHGNQKRNANDTLSATGLFYTVNGRNEGKVYAYSETGTVYAYGMLSGSHCKNVAEVTAEGNGTDYGLIAAGGAGEARNECINEGAISATAKSAGMQAYAVGVAASYDARECYNYGSIRAEGVSSSIAAIGMQNISFGENNGSVTVVVTNGSEDGLAIAYGVDKCNTADNWGEVYARCDGLGSALSSGCNQSKFGENYGNVSAVTQVGYANAYGCRDCSYSVNHGEVLAQGTSNAAGKDSSGAGAVGVHGNDCINHGSVNADHAVSASAVGASGGYSDGHVTAQTRVFELRKNSETSRIGTSTAEGSSFVSALNPAYTLNASGGEFAQEYVYTTKNGARGHRTIRNGNTKVLDSYKEAGSVASATSLGEQTLPEIHKPERPEQEEEQARVTVLDCGLYDYGSADPSDKGIEVDQLYLSCGSFWWYRKGEQITWNIDEEELSDFSSLTAWVTLSSSKIDGETEDVKLRLTLPDGFSFSPDELVREKEEMVSFSDRLDYCLGSVYPLYTHYDYAYKTTMDLGCEISGTNVYFSMAEYSMASVTNNPITNPNGSRQAKLYLTESSELDYDWNEHVFLNFDGFSYSAPIAMLSGYIAETIEKRASNVGMTDYLLQNLVALGFSNIHFGSAGEDYVCATKKLVDGDGKVKTIFLLAVQGSDRFNDWINMTVTKNVLPVAERLAQMLPEALRDKVSQILKIFSYANELTGLDLEILVRALNVQASVEEYREQRELGSYRDDKNISILTGHGRGGSIANILGSTADWEDGQASPVGNLAAYSFGPMGYTDSHFNNPGKSIEWFPNLYSIIYFSDVCPWLPGGMSTVGQHMVIGDYNADMVDIITMGQMLTEGWYLNPLKDGYVMVFSSKLFAAANVTYNHSMESYRWQFIANPEGDWGLYDGLNDEMGKPEMALKIIELVSESLAYMTGNESAQQWSLGEIKDWAVSMGIQIFKKIYVHCPVDVTVLDSENRIVGQILNDQIVNTSGKLILFTEGDHKQIIMPADAGYRVELSGYADGTMDYTVVEEQGGERRSLVSYRQIPIEENAEYIVTDQNITVKKQKYQPNTAAEGEQIPTVNVKADSVGAGASAFGSGIYAQGEGVHLMARCEAEGAVFEGWVEEGTERIVSKAEDYYYIAEQDVSLKAVYSFDASKHTHRYGRPVFTWNGVKEASASYACADGDDVQTVPASVKKYTYPASFATDGSIVYTATAEFQGSKDKDERFETISKLKTITAKDMVYTGKKQTPGVTVKDENNSVVSSSAYTVKANKTLKNPGNYTLTVKFKGKYTGTIDVPVRILPKGIALKSLASSVKKTLKVSFGTAPKQISGIEIQYALKKSFKSAVKVKVAASKSSITIKKLKSGKTYYVRSRTYKKVSGGTLYSKWSSVLKKKVK